MCEYGANVLYTHTYKKDILQVIGVSFFSNLHLLYTKGEKVHEALDVVIGYF